MEKLQFIVTRDETATIATALRTLAWQHQTATNQDSRKLVRECKALVKRIEGPLPAAPPEAAS